MLCANSYYYKVAGRAIWSFPFFANSYFTLTRSAISNEEYWETNELNEERDAIRQEIHEKENEELKARPQLAGTDYVHFTPRGAEAMGKMFFESLMLYYDYYRLRRYGSIERQ